MGDRFGAGVLGMLLVALAVGCGDANSNAAGDGSAAAGSSGAPATAETGGRAAGGLAAGGAAGAGGTTVAAGGAAGAGDTTAGAAGMSGHGSLTGGSAGAATGGTTGGRPELGACPEMPIARHGTGVMLELLVRPMFEGKPLVFAEENPVSSGGTLTPLGLRFYISEVVLERPAAEPLPVDVVAANGTPAPYGVHLFNAEDVASGVLRVLAPTGDYTAISFLLGLKQACNTRHPDANRAPLSATSQMTWPHTGYLFLRYEGRFAPGVTGAGGQNAGSAGLPPAIHMGGNLYEALAPRVRVVANLSVTASAAVPRNLHFVMDEAFKGATAEVDLSGFTGPNEENVRVGERLRLSMPGLQLFQLGS
ncbi:MAG TPA: MbnP family protein [Polyangiaceae bacterium]|nr:MbnP family protein [Polyangiaceae bacterium]